MKDKKTVYSKGNLSFAFSLGFNTKAVWEGFISNINLFYILKFTVYFAYAETSREWWILLSNRVGLTQQIISHINNLLCKEMSDLV